MELPSEHESTTRLMMLRVQSLAVFHGAWLGPSWRQLKVNLVVVEDVEDRHVQTRSFWFFWALLGAFGVNQVNRVNQVPQGQE